MRIPRGETVVFLALCLVQALVVLGSGPEDRGVMPQVNPIFVTSVSGTGDLSTWADSGGNSGLGAADAICRARALAGGLANAAQYVAWLSDSTDDAYCRIHSMTGKKSANCGLTELPSYAGPWARTDSHPFGAKIYLLLGPAGQVFAPVLLDEFGVESSFPNAFTGTDANGEYDPGTSAGCADWTSDAFLGVGLGILSQTSQSWTQWGTGYCSDSYPILCMLPGSGPEPLPLYNQGALAFVTSSMGKGLLGDWPEAGGLTGIAAGDNICRLRALAGGLPHPDEFKAWLSTSTVNAADRVTFNGPWVRPDGVIVAETKAQLVSGQLHAPINQDVFGAYYGNHGVWTGTQNDGIGSGASCSDWTSNSGGMPGTLGVANGTTTWSEFGPTDVCSSYGSLYCLSNVPSAVRIFLDGFETTDADQWSTASP